MTTQYFRTRSGYASVGTTRYITITTAAAQQLILDTGYRAMTIFNLGSGSLIWGDSNIAVNSGNYLYVSAQQDFIGIQGDWSIYLRADSVSTIISATQFK